jgi:DNA repair protein RecN (Recombination protein N)
VLREIHVRNLAVLAEASVELGAGFNVLSGETGAGKSIVVDSLSLLAGARASAEMVRTGAEALTVSGVFEPEGEGWRAVLTEAGLEAEGEEVLVRREIGRGGRNRVFVNDQPTTLRLLADLGPYLLRIHGQRDELGLIEPDLQRAMLDRSGGAEAPPLLARVAGAFERHARLAERLETLSGDDRRNAEAITRSLGTAFALLFEEEGAAVERVGKAGTLLAEIEVWEPQAGTWGAELAEARIRLAETARSLRQRLDGLEPDPARLDFLEERLAVIERLGRKHGGDSRSVLARRAEIETELAELAGDAENRDELEVKAAAALAEYRESALALSKAREAWGQALVQRIEGELKDLGLARARLGVALERRRRAGSVLVIEGEETDFGRDGIDQVVFLFAPNPGEPPRPLARIASGGELSRIHLALQLASRGEAEKARPTLVFDEVDTGIGGAEAAALGAKLQRLAKGGQILAVTHLPQVASHGDLHFKVGKWVDGGRTTVRVEALDARARIEEVARMLAGKEITDTSLSHARELIAGAARRQK